MASRWRVLGNFKVLLGVSPVLFGLALANACATSEDLAPYNPGETPTLYGGAPSTESGGSPGNGGSSATNGGSSATNGGASTGTGGFSFGMGGRNTAGSTGNGGFSFGMGGRNTAGSTGNGGFSFGSGGRAAAGGSTSTAGSTGTGDCDFAACPDKACDKGCPGGDGNYCSGACTAYITCFQGHPGCATADDPYCVKRNGASTAACTTQWENAGGQPTGPAATGPTKAAADLIECACGAK